MVSNGNKALLMQKDTHCEQKHAVDNQQLMWFMLMMMKQDAGHSRSGYRGGRASTHLWDELRHVSSCNSVGVECGRLKVCIFVGLRKILPLLKIAPKAMEKKCKSNTPKVSKNISEWDALPWEQAALVLWFNTGCMSRSYAERARGLIPAVSDSLLTVPGLQTRLHRACRPWALFHLVVYHIYHWITFVLTYIHTCTM